VDGLLGFLLLLLLILVLYWVFFRQAPQPPVRGRPATASGNPVTTKRPRQSAKTPPRKRTQEEIAAEKELREREREEDRLDQIEERRRKLEEKRAEEEEAKRKSLEEVTQRMEEEEERRRRLAARESADSTIGREFARYIAAPVPNDVKRSMQAFLAGEFVGSDRSPLAYVGYRVGKTNGLPAWDRERRMQVCLRIDIPGELRRDYGAWAGPGSRTRLNAMHAHIRMLAAMRRDRPGYEVAVAEWERDAEWLKKELGDLVDKFSRHGVTW
jgi:hypothetical protein